MKKMKQILKRAALKTFNYITIQKYLEHFYPRLLKIMNYGGGGDFKTSGELKIIKHISQQISPSNRIIIFDAGANIGDFSLALNDELKNRNIRIYSFEPAKTTYTKMVKRVEGINSIIPLNLGLSDKVSKQHLYSDANTSGLASVYNRRLDHFNINLDNSEEISLTTIDKFCEDNEIESIDFIKIDVEGHELKVLLGAVGMINRGKIRYIQFEFGGCNIDSRTFFQDFYYFLSGRYNLYRIIRNGMIPVLKYSEAHEVFLTVNYFAELK